MRYLHTMVRVRDLPDVRVLKLNDRGERDISFNFLGKDNDTLNAAVGNHDDAATASAIERLQALLPPQSLTLLRARAWAAHAGGNAVRI